MYSNHIEFRQTSANSIFGSHDTLRASDSTMSRGHLRSGVRLLTRQASSQTKPFYVTTPIFYVNARPHLGHVYSMLLADVRVRWDQLQQKPTFLLTGTDEHGLKIQAAAEKNKVSPQQLVDSVTDNFKQLASVFDVQPDRFIRTTDSDHVKAVQYFWEVMESRGLIYKGNHSGWYSISDEAFYPESQVEMRDGRRVSIETGNEVVFHEETNYFFRLSQFQQQLLSFVEATPSFVNPPQKYDELLKILRTERLEDLSVSRPSSRLTWGIAVPGDDTQKIYVWFDALVNYLTAANYPEETPMWPADVHIVGKDIMRFHCIYWPLFLLAADLPLPKQVLVHSHWLSEGVKMSKSLGNVVEPVALAESFGVDPTRFYLMENATIATDCKFTETELLASHAQLVNKWANICSRLGGSKFDMKRAVEAHRAGNLDFAGAIRNGLAKDPEAVLAIHQQLVSSVDLLFSDMNEHILNFNNPRALRRWWETVVLANEFFQACEPWVYALALQEAPNEAYTSILDSAIFSFAEAGRVSSICALPFMPQLALKFLDNLGVGEHRTSAACCYGGDLTYGHQLLINVPKVMTKLN